MNRYGGFPGPLLRPGRNFELHRQMHEAGGRPIEWAIFALAIVILVVVLLLLADSCRRRRFRRQMGWHGPGGFDKPLAIVRMRYSRGEIGREEYLQTLEDLGAAPEQKAAPAAPEAVKGGAPPRRRGRKQP